jgi:hypothetical protein
MMPALGAGGRRFKSGRPHHTLNLNSKSENHAFLLVSLQTNPLNLIATLGRTKYEMQNQRELYLDHII